MKKINFIAFINDTFQSSKVLAYALLIFTAMCTTLILASSYYVQNIVSNGVSKQDIIAKKNFEVIDSKKTDFYKQEAASKVRPILVAIDSNYIKDSYNNLAENITEISESNFSQEEKYKKISALIDITDQQKRKEAVEYIMYLKGAALSEFLKNGSTILNRALQIGLTDSDFEKNNIGSLFFTPEGNSIKRSQIIPLMVLIEHVVVPNLIIDEQATETLKNKAKDAINPYTVTFKRGDYILKEGEPITQLKKDALKKAGYTALELNKGSVLGLFALVCLAFSFLLVYIKKYEKSFLNFRHSLIQAFLLLFTAILSVLTVHYNATWALYLILPSYTLILAIFTTPILASLSIILVLLLFSVVLNFDQQTIFALMFTNIMASYSVSKINYTKRFDLIKCGFDIASMAFATNLFINLFEWDLDIQELQITLHFVIASFVSSVVALGCLPFIEKIFKTVTPYGLIELADHNQELLATLQNKAPGTYHHSLTVANLCEAAAEAVGGNPILARVGAFYHDIGKLERPLFFIENQSYFDIENPHVQLNPRLSKMVITSHTKDGVKLAKEHGLPQSVINFIQQHHGESLAGHFYQQAIQIEGKENVSEEQFRYPGPKPNTKETAILMLADAVESAVRSLKNPKPEDIEAMISKIITERLNDGQLSDSPLTLKDIKLIASTFNRILKGMQHDRIKYQENINEMANKNKIIFEKNQEEKLVEKKIKKHLENENGEQQG